MKDDVDAKEPRTTETCSGESAQGKRDVHRLDSDNTTTVQRRSNLAEEDRAYNCGNTTAGTHEDATDDELREREGGADEDTADDEEDVANNENAFATDSAKSKVDFGSNREGRQDALVAQGAADESTDDSSDGEGSDRPLRFDRTQLVPKCVANVCQRSSDDGGIPSVEETRDTGDEREDPDESVDLQFERR